MLLINSYEALLVEGANVQSDLSELKAKLAEIEASHLLWAGAAKDEAGKPFYTNESVRSAGAHMALMADEKAITLTSNIAERERSLALAKAKAEAQRLRVRAGLAWLRFLAKGEAE
jgi:hypothetical protein